MASSDTTENSSECKTCQCGEGEKNIWKTAASENSDKLPQTCPNCQIIKSGPLFVSSKGIGWTSWKKRWFILTPTSLVFYRVDPKGTEANQVTNPTLGGIDLNNSGSVVVKPDKKLLTVFFPDGQDGRTFTLKGETLDELQEWKTALENALAQAPSAGPARGQSGILRNELADSVETSFEQWRGNQPAKSMVIGRPVLLALEDVDGSPTFLERALRFIEEYGIKVEGILRQSADVEHVHRRVHEYEQGKEEFSPDEDAHVIGDCIKYVLREMSSSPVPASCCTSLVEAYKNDRGNRIDAIRTAISETFPEPNLRLLQRCLQMMLTVASHRSVNLMSLSALAACMAPLLLRPLLAGECDFEDDFNMGGDGSFQLLKAAAAANHAQAILMIMLEDYERIFDDEILQDGSFSSEMYTESEEDIDYEESTGSDILDDDEEDLEHSSSGRHSANSSYLESDLSDNQEEDHKSTVSSYSLDTVDVESTESPSTLDATTLLKYIGQKSSQTAIPLIQDAASFMKKSVSDTSRGSMEKFKNRQTGSISCMKRPTRWERTSGRKSISAESIDYSSDEENAIQRLETTKSDLQTKVTKEEKGNAVLRESLQKRKEALQERRLALEKDVERLWAQLQKERDLRASLQPGLKKIWPGHVAIIPTMDNKTRVDLEEINLAEADITHLKQKATDLRGQISQQAELSYAPLCISCNHHLHEETDQQKHVTSTLLHQNENPCESLSTLAYENVQAGKLDLPSSTNRETSGKATPQPTRQTSAPGNSTSTDMSSTVNSVSLPNKFTSMDEVSAPADNEDVKSKSEDPPLSPKDRHKKHKKSKKSRDKVHDLESRIISSNKEPDAIFTNAAPTNFSAREENPMAGAEWVSHKSQPKDSVPSTERKSSQKQLQGDEEMTASSSASKKSISENENLKSGAGVETENSKAQNQNSPTLGDVQPSHKQLLQATCRRSKSKDASPSEEPSSFSMRFSLKKSSFRAEKEKKEPQDSPRLPHSRLSQRQSSINASEKPIGQSEDLTRAGRTTVSRRSFRSEDATTPATSSALTRLSNRLHFLKERRVQLVNELQNLDSAPPTAPPKPLARTNSR